MEDLQDGIRQQCIERLLTDGRQQNRSDSETDRDLTEDCRLSYEPCERAGWSSDHQSSENYYTRVNGLLEIVGHRHTASSPVTPNALRRTPAPLSF
jgi:hypothetical protein